MKVSIDAYWGIGDVLLGTPAIALVRKVLGPTAHITHRTMEVPFRGHSSIVWGNPNIDQFDTASDYDQYPKVPTSAPGVDLTINLGGYQWYELEDLARYHARAPHSHSFCRLAVEQMQGVIGVDASRLGPYVRTLFQGPAKRPEYYTTDKDARVSKLHPRGRRKRVVMCRATKNCPAKTWPPAKWQELAFALRDQGHEVVSVGVRGDFHFEDASLDLVGKMTFRETAHFLTTADVYIGHGDGLSMVAYALDVPMVCLWGSFCDPAHYFNLEDGVDIMGRVLPCSYRFTRDYNAWRDDQCPRGTYECIRGIEVDEVLAAVKRQWRKHD